MQFKDLGFHKTFQKKLIENVLNKKIAHAQLFWGPSGNGKLSLALAYAQFLLCKKRETSEIDTVDSCGVCSSCQKVHTLTHPDLHIIFPVQASEGSSSVTSFDYMNEFRTFVTQYKGMVDVYSWLKYTSEVRKEEKKKLGIINTETIERLLEQLQITPAESNYKIIIIWLPEYIQYQAIPKLLKTLEEPFLNTIFLLVSEDRDAILLTILSRLQQWYLPPLKINEIYDFLKQHFPSNTEEEISHATYFGRNNGSKALEYLLNQDKWNFILDFFKSWMRATFKYDALKLQELAFKFAELSRDQQKQLLIEASLYISDCFRYKNKIPPYDILLHPEKEFFTKFSEFVTLHFYETFVKETDKALHDIERNGHPRLIFWTFSLKLVKAFSQKK